MDRFEGLFSPEPMSGCWLWTGADDGNKAAGRRYGVFRFASRTAMKAHRASWTLYRGDIPQGLQVLHGCDMACCVNPDHLFLGTQLDNVADCVAKGRRGKLGAGKGELHPESKLTTAQVLAIHADARPPVAVAADYGVSRATIHHIRKGVSWRHLHPQIIINELSPVER